MRRPLIELYVFGALALLVVPIEAVAQDAGAANAELSGGPSSGAVAANLAAGDANQQANVGVVALGQTGLSIATVAQSLSNPPLAQQAAAQAGIADDAFAGSSGWIAANIAAGSANQQANIASIASGLSGQALTATLLSQSRAESTKPGVSSGDDPPTQYATHIGDGAFAASSGVVQVNIAAGDRNTSANVFGLSIAASQ
jgi:hypothetical protein